MLICLIHAEGHSIASIIKPILYVQATNDYTVVKGFGNRLYVRGTFLSS